MNNVTVNESEEIVMKLLHYFMTKHNYNPIVLHGVQNEIWLENINEDYKVIRIVTNYIHNNEQFNYDMFKTQKILKQIKRKMFITKVDTLNLFINLGDNVELEEYSNLDHMEIAKIEKDEDINKYSFITDSFPDLDKHMKTNKKGLDLLFKLSNDISEKNKGDAKMAEDVFAPKNPIITKILISILVVMFIFTTFFGLTDVFAVNRYYILSGEYYRLLTGTFVHAGVLHLLFNCYALYVIGSQLEGFLGKAKYLIVYLFSAFTGSLLSIMFSSGFSVGASGAIFGLMGSLVYFGYHYRVYLGTVIRSQIIPLILLNLCLGFAMSNIDNWAHIGGLIGGALITVALGIKYKSTKFEMINGAIISLLFVLFLCYMIFVRGI